MKWRLRKKRLSGKMCKGVEEMERLNSEEFNSALKFINLLLAYIVFCWSASGLYGQLKPKSTLSLNPSFGKGLSAEFILSSNSESVIVIFNSNLNGNGGCYFVVIPATAQVFVYNDSTGDWVGQGDQCSVTAAKEGENVRLNIQFSEKWQGDRNIYLLERNGEVTGEWQVAGSWDTRKQAFKWIRPVVGKTGPPGPPGATGEKGDKGDKGEDGKSLCGKPVFQVRELKGEDKGEEMLTLGGLIFLNGVYQSPAVDYVIIRDGIGGMEKGAWLYPKEIKEGDLLTVVWFQSADCTK